MSLLGPRAKIKGDRLRGDSQSGGDKWALEARWGPGEEEGSVRETSVDEGTVGRDKLTAYCRPVSFPCPLYPH